MKTPDEIKKALACTCDGPDCENCVYVEKVNDEEFGEMLKFHCSEIYKDALAYIQQLETRLAGACGVCAYNFTGDKSCLAHIKQLESRLAHVERERDAALSEWKRTKMDSEGMCWTCKHGFITDIGSCRCVSPDPCDEGENWEWRGVRKENTKEDTTDEPT